jgi:hypothetical protein
MISLLFLILSCFALDIRTIPSSTTPPTYRRALPAAFSPSDQSIFLFGGARLSGDTYTNILWQFNISTSKWSQLSINTPSQPVERAGSAMAFYQNSLYLYGGLTRYGPSAGMWRFNVESKVWSEIYPIGNPGERALGAFCSFSWNGVAYMALFGGYSSEKSVNSLHL